MKKNVGSTDRIVRMVLAIAIGYFGYSTEFDAAWLQYVLLGIAGIMLVTPVLSYCPLYTLLGTDTCDVKKA